MKMDQDQIDTIEALEARGFVIILKWDGERVKHTRTVVITLPNTDYVFHKDTNDLTETLVEALDWANKIAFR